MTLYNDNDKFCCQWIRNLVDAGHLPDGRVECEDIRKLDASTLPETCHFFAGIGGWPLALKLAGWTEPVWSASCPCQPLSCAGKRKGHADERHLWPALYALIAKLRPATIFGEQVSGKDGREWLAGVRADLEGAGYAIGAADLCAAGAGAPQIRQRLYWVAIAKSQQFTRTTKRRQHNGEIQTPRQNETASSGRSCGIDGLEGTNRARWPARNSKSNSSETEIELGLPSETVVGVEHTDNTRRQGWNEHGKGSCERIACTSGVGFWSEFDIIPVGQEIKRIEPGTFPLAARCPADLAKLRAYGNGLCIPIAVEFVKAVMET